MLIVSFLTFLAGVDCRQAGQYTPFNPDFWPVCRWAFVLGISPHGQGKRKLINLFVGMVTMSVNYLQ